MIRIQKSFTPGGFRDNRLQTWAWEHFESNEGLINLGVRADLLPVLKQSIEYFTSEKRNVLHQVINQQYKHLGAGKISPETQENIDILLHSNSVTVVTGQQIHPFLGPVFVWNKIISTIQTAREINQKYPDYTAIPVFWMATEDHDFEEISRIPFLNKEYIWEYPLLQKGVPVGQLPTAGLVSLINQMQSDFAHELAWVDFLEGCKSHYINHANLADATRSLVNEWFGDLGLLVLDPLDSELKKLGSAVFQGETSELNFDLFEEQSKKLQSLSIQPPVQHRRTHLFYFENSTGVETDQPAETGIQELNNGKISVYETSDLPVKDYIESLENQQDKKKNSGSWAIRRRIDLKNDRFTLLDSDKSWSAEEFTKEIQTNPERFSPNVILRPAYQQAILPNVVYVAGPAEFRYWMQVPSVISSNGLAIPRLQLRLSSALITAATQKKMNQIGIKQEELYLAETELIKTITDSFENEFALDGSLEQLNQLLEKVRTQLHSIGYPNLKEVKKEQEEMIKRLRQASKSYKAGEWGENELSRKLTKLKQLKSSGFDSKNPWERSTFILELMLKFDFRWNKNSLPLDSIDEFIWFFDEK